jgi:hypothetical protein
MQGNIPSLNEQVQQQHQLHTAACQSSLLTQCSSFTPVTAPANCLACKSTVLTCLSNIPAHAVPPALSLQFPIFVYTAASIRYMARASWPGFSSEGALWFPDLTQQAMQLGQAADAAVLLPMGLPGLILPLAVTGIMLTSIMLGFKASGARWEGVTTFSSADCVQCDAGVQICAHRLHQKSSSAVV